MKSILQLALLVGFISCSSQPSPGPDKQGYGLLSGALMGAASGAVTGAQFTASAGPGAWIGAGFGALWGSINGMGLDILEEEDIRLFQELAEKEDDVWAQYAFLEHIEIQRELFPGRDIFPADNFFMRDKVTLTNEGRILARYLARKVFNKKSFSRIQIITYIQSKDSNSAFAKNVTKKRGEALALEFSQNGIEPRRLNILTVALGAPLVDDRYDSFYRYSQAVEFSLLDT